MSSSTTTLVDEVASPQAQQAVYIGLVNPKTPTNVGGIMRASGCYGVDAVFYTGKRYEYAARGPQQYNADTQSAAERIPLTGVISLLDAIPAGTQLVCVDLVLGATPLPEFVHPEKAFYVFGPEDGTIGQEIIDRADAVVYVPTVGCMNLAASVNVLLYDRLAKAYRKQATNAAEFDGDALIRKSRDNNNRTRVKTTKQGTSP